jgi:predicted acyl esterase
MVLSNLIAGEDCYDLIEAVAKYEWSNGAVGMAGNSWLGGIQYWAAMSQPPSLKAIAPWEGWADMYRDRMRRGGIPWVSFVKWVLLGVPGQLFLLQNTHGQVAVDKRMSQAWRRNMNFMTNIGNQSESTSRKLKCQSTCSHRTRVPYIQLALSEHSASQIRIRNGFESIHIKNGMKITITLRSTISIVFMHAI